MKLEARPNPTTSTGKDPKDPKDTLPRAAPLPPATSDLEADMLALDQEEEALRNRKAQRRAQYWDQAISSLSVTLQQIISF